VYWTVLCCHSHLVFLHFVLLLSLHLVMILYLFLLVYGTFLYLSAVKLSNTVSYATSSAGEAVLSDVEELRKFLTLTIIIQHSTVHSTEVKPFAQHPTEVEQVAPVQKLVVMWLVTNTL